MSDIDKNNMPKHIGIIMDGNRRWAREKGIDDKLGHKAGAEKLEEMAVYANEIGLEYLTVYAFSTENWKRTKEEVGALMLLLKSYIEKMLKRTDLNNIRINILGDISKLDKSMRDSIDKIMQNSSKNTGLTLNVAFNYGGRDEITKAVKKIAEKAVNGEIKTDDINEDMVSNNLYTAGQPEVDLLIRPGREKRVSNFLLWQIAYTELLFVDKYWPDFTKEDLNEAIIKFQNRNRKFGGK